jgi:hypothetical protein
LVAHVFEPDLPSCHTSSQREPRYPFDRNVFPDNPHSPRRLPEIKELGDLLDDVLLPELLALFACLMFDKR